MEPGCGEYSVCHIVIVHYSTILANGDCGMANKWYINGIYFGGSFSRFKEKTVHQPLEGSPYCVRILTSPIAVCERETLRVGPSVS